MKPSLELYIPLSNNCRVWNKKNLNVYLLETDEPYNHRLINQNHQCANIIFATVNSSRKRPKFIKIVSDSVYKQLISSSKAINQLCFKLISPFCSIAKTYWGALKGAGSSLWAAAPAVVSPRNSRNLSCQLIPMLWLLSANPDVWQLPALPCE